MQGTQILSVVQKDSTGYEATKPVCRNYWAYMLQPLKPTHPRAYAQQQEKPLRWEALVLQLEGRPARHN